MNRKPVMAGHFYPAKRSQLEEELKEMIVISPNRRQVLGLIVPHAGYIYSGSCAGKGYGRIVLSDRLVLLGVNHRGGGVPLAVDAHDSWESPLGTIALDHDLRYRLLEKSSLFSLDSDAGRFEHSLEVQVPFIQYLNPNAAILPVHIHTHNKTELLAAGKELGRLLKETPGVTVIVSTDMSHYISADLAREKDSLAIERMETLDAGGLWDVVMKRGISMCGMAPAVVMLEAVKEAGASGFETVEYTNSGEVTRDYTEVVAYLSAIVF